MRERRQQLILEWEHQGKKVWKVLVGKNNAVEEVGTGSNGERLAFGVWKRVVVLQA